MIQAYAKVCMYVCNCMYVCMSVVDPGFGKGGDNIYKIVYIGGC